MPSSSSSSSYTDRITRILPTEFVATYLTVTQLVKGDLELRQPLLLICLAACLVLIPISLCRKGIKAPRYHCIVILSFVVWAYALGDAFQPGSWISFDLYRPILGAGFLVIWALVPTVVGLEEAQ